MSRNTLQEKLDASNLSLLYIFANQLTAKKSQVTAQVLLSMLWRGWQWGWGWGWEWAAAAAAAEDMSYSAWKQVTRISLKQHCALLGQLRLRDCNLTGSQLNLHLIPGG